MMCLQPDVESLLTVLALCHTIRVDRHKPLKPGEYSHVASLYDYQASSPDEKALVEACARYVRSHQQQQQHLIILKYSCLCIYA